MRRRKTNPDNANLAHAISGNSLEPVLIAAVGDELSAISPLPPY